MSYNSSYTNQQLDEIKHKVELYLSALRYQVAEKYLKELIASKADHPKIYNLLGLVYHQQSKFNLALEQFKYAWQAESSFLEARLNYTVTLCDLGEYQSAQNHAEKFNHYNDRQFNKPYSTLERLANKHEELGDDYHECNMHHHALLEYQKAVHLCKNKPNVLLKIASIYVISKNYAKAIPCLEKLLGAADYKQKALAYLGIIAYYTNNTKETIEYWTYIDNSQPANDLKLKISDEYLALQALAKSWKSHPRPNNLDLSSLKTKTNTKVSNVDNNLGTRSYNNNLHYDYYPSFSNSKSKSNSKTL